MPKILFKSIPLLPTQYKVDVWICNNKSALASQFNKRYGASADYYNDILTPNQCSNIISTSTSELKGEHVIVVNIKAKIASIIIHEMNHVVYYLSKITGLELNYNSQEWHSYMLEYLYTECMKNDYKQIN